MIRAIIFDCFGVLCHGGYYHILAHAPEENKQAVYDCNQAFDSGYLSRSDYISSLAELLGWSTEEVSDSISQQYHRNEAVFSFARSLKSTYKLGLLSNIGPGIINQLFTTDELNHLFDSVVLSGDVGMVKPYPEIFEYAAADIGEATAQCLMIDDRLDNIEGARMVGMNGIVYRDLNQLKADLSTLL